MDVVLVDDSFAYDGYTPRNEPLGGPEKAVVYLAEALARRGHGVTVLNRCDRSVDFHGVAWREFGADARAKADLLIAFRHAELLDTMEAGRRMLWLMTPASILRRPDAAAALARHPETTLVFMGTSHRATLDDEAARAAVIQPGVAPPYLKSEAPAGYWPSRAVVTTHPRMHLGWLLDLWTEKIEPMVRGSELHIYSGSLHAGSIEREMPPELRPLLDAALAAADQGVRVMRPMADHAMAEAYRHARVHLYPGDEREVYAATLAESQATGLPAVARRLGAAEERVVDGRSGFLTPDTEAFANCAILALKEDIVYRGRSRDAVQMQRGRTWDDAAGEIEAMAAG
jgi:hypothetical protein